MMPKGTHEADKILLQRGIAVDNLGMVTLGGGLDEVLVLEDYY